MIEKHYCKFCGEEMEWDYCDYDEYYYCNCEGTKHLKELKHEISELERQLMKKREELKNYENNSLYSQKREKLTKQIKELDKKYIDSDCID